jgi:hypothetical protein
MNQSSCVSATVAGLGRQYQRCTTMDQALARRKVEQCTTQKDCIFVVVSRPSASINRNVHVCRVPTAHMATAARTPTTCMSTGCTPRGQ